MLCALLFIYLEYSKSHSKIQFVHGIVKNYASIIQRKEKSLILGQIKTFQFFERKTFI